MLLLDPELLLLELVPLSPDAEPLEVELPVLSLLPLEDPELEAVSDDEPVLPPVPDACASNSTLITLLVTWPDELEPDELEFEALVGVFAAVESAVVVVDALLLLLLAVSALSKARRALAAPEEPALEIDICCSWKQIAQGETVVSDCYNHLAFRA